ncbi:MAG: hypothetical protein Q8Q62_21795 [Mesorhizobium sp.]|nr:hypothetical protein [Mesorhizobium sp.]
MKFFAQFFRARKGNMVTTMERQRLGRTMPGQTGAVAANRLGFFIG